jgi:bZIP transcription factor
MDYSSYFPPNYQSLTAANLRAANSTFQVSGQQPQRPQQGQNGQMAQLPQDMFFLNDDPFDVKMEAQARAGEIDLSSKTLYPCRPCHVSPVVQGNVLARKIDDGVDDSDNLFDDLDDLSRLGNVPQVTGANHSPLNGSISYPQPGQQDFELLDQNETSGNSTKRKAQNRAAQRAFRERKERHLKDLQAKTQELEQTTNRMNEENSRLKAKLQALEMENSALKGQNITFSFPVPPPSNSTQLQFMRD